MKARRVHVRKRERLTAGASGSRGGVGLWGG
ncbi:uncharacterized protein METZ01_LOCUS260310 [marine metagenome]|uniref:Uncharacterized protein n=1 Tax=marine metagenome TaxID=408172 RepID=A0A382J6E5_9ZZZZ